MIIIFTEFVDARFVFRNARLQSNISPPTMQELNRQCITRYWGPSKHGRYCMSKFPTPCAKYDRLLLNTKFAVFMILNFVYY